MNYYIKKFIKSSIYIFFANRYSTRQRIHEIKKRNRVTVLNLHRVYEDDNSSYKPMDPKIFEDLIIFLKENYEITTFSNLEKEINENNSKKPKVIISFDDGYKDFITTAHPILKRYKVRVNHNIIPGLIETAKAPLNVVLQDYIGKAPKEEWRSLSIPGYEWGANLSKLKEGLRVSKYIKNLTHLERSTIEQKLYEEIGERLNEVSTPMMSLNDIKSILNYHEWGVHSFNHSNMHVETDDFFEKDLIRCKEWFIRNVGYLPSIYAFPNNSYRNRQIEIAKLAGFNHILLVGDDFTSANNNIHPRFSYEAYGTREMRFKATGSFRNP